MKCKLLELNLSYRNGSERHTVGSSQSLDEFIVSNFDSKQSRSSKRLPFFNTTARSLSSSSGSNLKTSSPSSLSGKCSSNNKVSSGRINSNLFHSGNSSHSPHSISSSSSSRGNNNNWNRSIQTVSPAISKGSRNNTNNWNQQHPGYKLGSSSSSSSSKLNNPNPNTNSSTLSSLQKSQQMSSSSRRSSQKLQVIGDEASNIASSSRSSLRTATSLTSSSSSSASGRVSSSFILNSKRKPIVRSSKGKGDTSQFAAPSRSQHMQRVDSGCDQNVSPVVLEVLSSDASGDSPVLQHREDDNDIVEVTPGSRLGGKGVLVQSSGGLSSPKKPKLTRSKALLADSIASSSSSLSDSKRKNSLIIVNSSPPLLHDDDEVIVDGDAMSCDNNIDHELDLDNEHEFDVEEEGNIDVSDSIADYSDLLENAEYLVEDEEELVEEVDAEMDDAMLAHILQMREYEPYQGFGGSSSVTANSSAIIQQQQQQQQQRGIHANLFDQPYRIVDNHPRVGGQQQRRNLIYDDDIDFSYEGLLSLAERIGDVKQKGADDSVIRNLSTFKYNQSSSNDEKQ